MASNILKLMSYIVLQESELQTKTDMLNPKEEELETHKSKLQTKVWKNMCDISELTTWTRSWWRPG